MKTTTQSKALLLCIISAFLACEVAPLRGQSALDGFDPNANGPVRAVVVQANGKILIGGDFTTVGTPASGRDYIARLNADGMVDPTSNPNANQSVYSAALQPDGKILVGGDFSTIGGQTRNHIARLDIVAIQRQFLNVGTPPSGCRLTAADVNGDGSVTAVDVIATQRFFLGMRTGIANVGKYQFIPTNRSYTGLTTNQIGQNYDTLVLGDVTSGFVH